MKWQSLSDTPWCFSAPVALYNKFVLTVGGNLDLPAGGSNKSNEVSAFNPSTGSWRQVTNIPVARSFPAVVSVAGNKVIVLGGVTQQRNYSNDVWVGVFE